MYCLLVEHNSLVAVAENPSVQVPAHGAGEDNALQIAATGDQVFHLVPVGDAGHLLLDDGAVVEQVSDVMACGADQLNAARMGRVLGPGSGEGGQKRMVHIDDRGGVAGDKGRR